MAQIKCENHFAFNAFNAIRFTLEVIIGLNSTGKRFNDNYVQK